jgi:hypothetical protein
VSNKFEEAIEEVADKNPRWLKPGDKGPPNAQGKDWVQNWKNSKIELVSLEQYRASRAPFMLEFWVLPKEPNSINIPIRSFLWTNGEAMGPGNDQLIMECPLCNAVFLPPVKDFVKGRDREWDRVTRKFISIPIRWVFCPSCMRTFRRDMLVDNRTHCSTYDVLASHLAWRYRQLRETADVLCRTFREIPGRHVEGIMQKERGAESRLIRAEIRNNADCAYAFADTIIQETGKGVELATYFKGLLKA